jgi:hypothetical protein
MTKKEIRANAEAIAEVAKTLLSELESDLYNRLERFEKKMDGIDARIANLEDSFKGEEQRMDGFRGFNRGRVSFRAGRIENIEHYLNQLTTWLEEHPHCVCSQLNDTTAASWHCPIHGQVEVRPR